MRRRTLLSGSISAAVCLFGLSSLDGQSARVETSTVGIEASVEESSAAERLLLAAVQAIGPVDVFDAIESVRFHGVSQSLTGVSQSLTEDEEISAMTDILFFFPPGLEGLWMHSTHSRGPSEVFVRTLAGDVGTMQETTLLTPDLHSDAVRYASTKLLTLLRYRDHRHAEATYRGPLEGVQEAVDLVAVTLYGFTSELEIERATGRVLAVRFLSSEIQEGESGQVVRRAYADHRQVGELLLPFLQQVTVGGRPFSRWQLETVELDVEFDPVLFGRPSLLKAANEQSND